MDGYVDQAMFTYQGNKRKIINFIEEQVCYVKEALGKDRLKILDGFTGSGVVARMLSLHALEVHTNDMELYADIAARCFVQMPTEPQKAEIERHIVSMNELAAHGPYVEGLLTTHYAPLDTEDPQPGEICFYTRENALIIDTLRAYIESTVPPDLRNWCLGPLLVKAMVHSNTMGHTQGFFKRDGVGYFHITDNHWNNRMNKKVRVECPIWRANECKVVCHNKNINKLVKELEPHFDLIYYDPPYNKRDYSVMYSLLNVVALNEKPAVWSDITHLPKLPSSRDRSDYNVERRAVAAMTELIRDSLKIASYLLISYNEEGLIGSKKWKEILEPYEYRLLQKDHKRYKCRGVDAPVKIKEILYLVSNKG